MRAPTASGRYAIVTPVRDEAEHFIRTAEAIVGQERRPERWVVVDDGSTDGTRAIAERYAAAHPWIQVLAHEGAGRQRARGAPVVRAFKAGLPLVPEDVDVVVKLDGDLYLPPHYFAWVMRVFDEVLTAGIVGGSLLVPAGEEWVPDKVARHSVHGAVKAYRRTCLEAIGGLHESMGWDGIDEYAARARGWGVHQLTELPVLHYKPRGSKQHWIRARWEEGRGAHFMGYDPRFVLVRAGFRMVVEAPPVLGGAVLGLGYAASALRGTPQVPDPAARAELRREQRARLRGLLRGRFGTTPIPVPGGGPAFRPPVPPTVLPTEREAVAEKPRELRRRA